MGSVKNPQGGPAMDRKAVKYDGKEYGIVREGLAEILKPQVDVQKPPKKKPAEAGDQSQSVFYNPIQQFNRDLSVLAIRVYGEDLQATRKVNPKVADAAKIQKSRKRKREEIDDASVASNGKNAFRQRTNTPPGKEAAASDGDPQPDAVANGVQAKASNETAAMVEEDDDDSVAIGCMTAKRPSEMDSSLQDSVDGAELPKDQREPEQESASGEKLASTNIEKGSPRKSHFRILDALSATGLRALRYAKEIPMVTSVTANDISVRAKASIELNIQHNDLVDKIRATASNALSHMYYVASGANHDVPGVIHGKYDVIDLDPYGGAAPFLDAAVQALHDGGLLCVTCTDAGVFASAGYMEKTFSQYGGLPLKGVHSHEGGIRLILNSIATSAARYGIAIEPLLSLSIDFYVRLFVRVRHSAAEVKFLAGKTMIVYNCDSGCGAWKTQYVAQSKELKARNGDIFYKFSMAQAPTAAPTCDYCGFKTHLAGPMWGGPIHNPYFVQQILDMLPSLDRAIYTTVPRIEGMLSLALHETLLDSVSGQPSDISKGAQIKTSVDPPAEEVQIITEPPKQQHQNSEDTLISPDPPRYPLPRLDPALRDRHPFFIIVSALSKVLHCQVPSDALFRSALLNLGYHVRSHHAKPGSIRTDAPWNVIWEVMREWVRQKSPIKEGSLKKGTAGWHIMKHDPAMAYLKEEFGSILGRMGLEDADFDKTKVEVEAALYRAARIKEGSRQGTESPIDGGQGRSFNGNGNGPAPTSFWAEKNKLKIVFDEALGKREEGKKMVRYQTNPRENWGPQVKAKGGK